MSLSISDEGDRFEVDSIRKDLHSNSHSKDPSQETVQREGHVTTRALAVIPSVCFPPCLMSKPSEPNVESASSTLDTRRTM
jgi:hypothetical protein